MGRLHFALATSVLVASCVVSFEGYRAHDEAEGGGNGGSSAASGRGGTNQLQGGEGGDKASTLPAAGQAGEGGYSGEGGHPADDTGGSGGGAGDGTGGTPMFCPIANRGPQLLEIPSPAGGIYCIDRTEVSSIHYAAFLESSPDTGDQPAECAFNTTFAPEMSADCDPLPYDPESARPVTCVDWCDARKFCEWAGKELCGAIGGGPVAAADYADPAHDAWFSACSENGQREFPYGNDYDGLSCGGLDYPSTSPLAVATLSQCEGGYNGLWDMSGNVSEWENSCDGSSGGSDECLHRGGGLFDADETPVTLRCNSVGSSDPLVPATHPRDRRHEFLGFRCCSFL